MGLAQSADGQLLAAHRALDTASRQSDGKLFISDWYCEHPFVDDALRGVDLDLHGVDLAAYCFHSDHHDLQSEIRRFHEIRDGVTYEENTIYVTAGLSPLITAQMMMLRRLGYDTLYYTRPAYYTYYFHAETLGLRMVSVNDRPLDMADVSTHLPDEQGAVLLVTDPVWHLGRPIDGTCWDRITAWQNRTGGLVLVDGAFQYLNWSTRRVREHSASLNPSRTLRNLCPTKTVAVHGPRFAYCLVPAHLWEDLRYCYSNSAGSSSVFDHVAARAIMRSLNLAESNDKLLDLIQARYERLTELEVISDEVGARASYFCFVRTSVDPERLRTMGQVFFDSTSYDGMVRMNLLLRERTLRAFVDAACGPLAASDPLWTGGTGSSDATFTKEGG